MLRAQHPPGQREQLVSRFGRVLSPLLILAGLSLIGVAAAPPPPGVSHVDIARQRARFAAMERMPSATPTVKPAHDSVSIAWEIRADVQPESMRPATPPVGPPTARPRFLPPTAIADRRVAPAQPTEAPTPAVVDMPPATHIAIPAVGVDADVREVNPSTIMVDGRLVLTWQVAGWAAGHHATSADPGERGNIVIAGHDDVRGEVFRGLHDIELGDEILLTSPTGTHHYVVAEVHLRRENDAPLDERLAAGVFMNAMPEERLTLITCWPYGIDDHRLIVVAKPQTSPA